MIPRPPSTPLRCLAAVAGGCLLLAAATSARRADGRERADLILNGGRLITVDPAMTRAAAVGREPLVAGRLVHTRADETGRKP